MSTKLTRRQFVSTSTAAGLALGTSSSVFGQAPAVRTGGSRPVVIASDNGNVYKNGGTKTGVQLAFEMMTSGGKDVLDVARRRRQPVRAGSRRIGRRLRRPAQRRRRRAARLVLHARPGEAGRRRRRARGRAHAVAGRQGGAGADRPPPARRQGRAGLRAPRWASRSRTTSTPRSRARLWLEWKRRVDPEHYLDPKKRDRAGLMAGLSMVQRRPHRPEPLLGHDQLRRRERQGRGLRRDHDQRPGVEDSRPRRRLADPRRRALRGQRSRRRRVDRPRRGQSLQPLLVPDRRADARWASRRRTPAWRRCAASRPTPSRSGC